MSLTANAKGTLRKNIKLILSSMSEQSRKQQSQLILNKLQELDWYRSSERVGVYLSMAEEVQTDAIVHHLLQTGKQCFIPWYQGPVMKLVRLNGLDDFASLPLTRWNIRQPADSDVHLREDALSGGLDLVIVPGLGFTKAGQRLGRGKGYYDSFLHAMNQNGKHECFKVPRTVGLAFREQILKDIPCNEHDFTLDLVISPDLN